MIVRKLFPTLLGAAVVFTTAIILLIVLVLGLLTAPSEDASAAEEPTCTPGGGNSSAVVVPDEYQDYVESAAKESGLSVGIIAAQLKAESNWDPKAVSPVGAKGLAQFMPATWKEFGDGGDPFNPKDAIAAQGRYMKHLKNLVKDHAKGDKNLVELTLAAYNAGPGKVKELGYDMGKINKIEETRNYVENITKAAKGDYTTDCEDPGDGGAGGDGDILKTAKHLAWDKRVELPRSTAARHGEDAAKPEYVKASQKYNKSVTTAFFTDCGVYVATVMRMSGADKKFPLRGTTDVQLPYLKQSDKYKTFKPRSEGDLKAGDIMITPGHIYIYSGKRRSGPANTSLAASLYTRPPSGQDTYGFGSYTAARLVKG